jgi:hypothetical protein
MTTMLSPHFSLEEFTASQTASRMGIPNQPVGQDLDNVRRTAEVMEKVRTLLGDKPILISSGYRCPELNSACGGSSTSAHMYGLAADFTCPEAGDPVSICHVLEPYMQELGIDQLISEFNPGGWVHLGLSMGAPRCMAMTIDNSGTQMGIA